MNPLLSNDLKAKKTNESIEVLAAEYVASILLEDGFLLPEKFKIYKNFIIEIFSFKVSESVKLRTKLLNLIVNSDLKENKFENMLEAYKTDYISLEAKKTIVNYTLLAIENNLIYRNKRIDEIELLIREFELPMSDFSIKIDYIKGLRNTDEINYSKISKNSLNLFTRNFSISKGSNSVSLDFITKRSIENESLSKLVLNLKILNKIIGSEELKTELKITDIQIEDQVHRIALIGEIKHGKSSLFNRLIGEEISPVGEGTATTAAIVELIYSKETFFEAKWISEDGILKRLKYIEQNNNLHVQEYAFSLEQIINKEYFEKDKLFNSINSSKEIKDYVDTKGEYTAGVEKLIIKSPVECLKRGAILIDTPGLNDPMKVRDALTKEQAMMADTIVFVMRADKFGTESERQFLIDILEKTKASSLIIVLTHIDRIIGKEDPEKLFNGVKEWLNRVSNSNIVLEAPIYAFNASYRGNTMEKEIKTGTGFEAFVNRLSSPIDESSQNKNYIKWIQEKKLELNNLALKEVEKFIGLSEKNKNELRQVNQIKELIDQLEEISIGYERQLDFRISEMKGRLKSDYSALKNGSKNCERLIKENLRAAIEAKVRELGNKYSNKDKWSVFNKDTATNIVRVHTQELHYNAQEIINSWDFMVKDLDQSLHEDFEANSARLEKIRNSYSEVSLKDEKITYSLCQASELFSSLNKTIDKVKYLGAGYIVSAGIATGTVKSIISGAVSLAFPPSLPWIVGGVTFAAIGVKITGILDKDKQKFNFIQKKEKEVNDSLDGMFKKYNDFIEEEYNKFYNNLLNSIDNIYIPIIENGRANVMDLKLQIQIEEIVKNDTMKYANSLININKY